MTYLVPLALFVGFVISLVMVALLVRAGRRAGMLDSSGSEGHHKQLRSIPNIGGIGIFLGAVVPLGIGLGLLSLSESVWSLLPGSIRPPDDLVAQSLPTWVAIVAAALVLHVVGLVDDRRPLGAGLKLLVQAVMAASLVLLFDVRFLHVLDDFGGIGWSISVVGTILWILVITNAINFLDNMDGLAAGVAVVASTIMMIATLMNAQWFIALSLALLIGSLLGFLVFNFPVARIFMGDGGSLVVGWLLAIATVRITFVDTGDPDYALGSAWYGVLMPLVVTSVVVIRTLQGRSPFVGDQQHFSHRLVARGLSSTRAVLVIWLVAIVTGVGGIFLGSVAPWIAILIGVQTLLLLCMLAVLEHGTRSEGGRG